MRQSLAEAAVSGTSTLTDEKRELLGSGDIEGLMALNRKQFGGFSMKGEDDDIDDDDENDDDADDDDDDDDDDDEDEDKGKKKPDAKDRRIQELSSESAKHRKRASERGRRIAELEAENAQLKKGKPTKAKSKDDEDDDADEADDSEKAKLKEENEKLQTRLVNQQLRSEFADLTSGAKPLAQFKNPKAAFKLLELDDVEIEDDGEIIGLDEAIKALAKSEPYLLLDKKSKDDDDEDDDDEDEKPQRRRTGQQTGQQKRRKGNPNRDKLLNKYPALRR